MARHISVSNPGRFCNHKNGNARYFMTVPTSLAPTLRDLRRRFGAGSIMRLGEATHLLARAIPTGFPALDAALGIGGLPRGRIVDIYGPEGSGKTTLCLHVIAEAQKQWAAIASSSTWTAASTPATPPGAASTSTGSTWANPAAGKRRWKWPRL